MDPTIKDFESAIAELETIVKTLEEGDLALEKSLALFERGVQLSRFCHSKLEEAERPEESASLKTEYKKGDKIKVNNGAFQNFEGEVDEIIPDKGTVRIITTIFGRPTPLELEYWQIEKM